MRRKREGRGENKEYEEQGGCELSHPRNIFHEIDNSLKTYFTSETNENRPIYVISKNETASSPCKYLELVKMAASSSCYFSFEKCIVAHASLVRGCAGT